MRKRVINHVADTIFWYILYFLPVLAYLMFVISAPFVGDEEVDYYSYEIKSYTLPAGYEFSGFNVAQDYTSVSISGEVLPGVVLDSTHDINFMPVELLEDFGLSHVSPEEFSFAYYGLYSFDTASGLGFSLACPFTFYVTDLLTVSSFEIYVDGSLVHTIPLSSFEISSTFLSGETTYTFWDTYDFKYFVNSMGFEFATDNIIVNSLADIFGTGGIMPMFDNDTPFIIFAWFIGVYLLHLLVDFLLFIPRIAHKWMKDCAGGD